MAPFLPTVYLMWEKMPANKRPQAWDTRLNLTTSSAEDPLWQWLSLSGHCPAPLHPQGSTWTEHIHVSPPLCRAVGPLQELFAQDNERGQHPVGLQRAGGHRVLFILRNLGGDRHSSPCQWVTITTKTAPGSSRSSHFCIYFIFIYLLFL